MTGAGHEANVLATLRREIRARGWHRKPTRRIVAELMLSLAIAAIGATIAIGCEDLWWRGLGMVILTIGTMGVATNAHTSSHYATSDRRWVNEALTYLGCPVLLGLSATYWWHKHVARHHAAPNVVGRDDDIDLLPWFVLTEADLARTSGLRRFYHRRVQCVLLPAALALNAFQIQGYGWHYVVQCLRDPARRKRLHWLDLGALGVHLILNFVLPMLYVHPVAVCSFYVVRIAMLGYAMFAVFGPGHLPHEAAVVNAEAVERPGSLRVSERAVDFRTGPIGRLVCSGLEFQIEHHLFPDVSHVFYPEMRAMVAEACARTGVTYRCYGWGEAVAKALRAFAVPKRIGWDQGAP
jgi:fatty acid desaturase